MIQKGSGHAEGAEASEEDLGNLGNGAVSTGRKEGATATRIERRTSSHLQKKEGGERTRGGYPLLKETVLISRHVGQPQERERGVRAVTASTTLSPSSGR